MKLPFFHINWNQDDIKSVQGVIESGNYWCLGKEISEFEEAITKYLDVKYCVTYNSGGSALLASMIAANIGQGDEVIVPSFTFIATAYAPLYVNAKPVFADVEEKTFGLDPEDVERKITNKTKAILPIHYGGVSCDIEALKKICKKHHLLLIEDAAEAFGAKLNNKKIGQFGDMSIFSFCQNKIFTTGEGGCVVTNNNKLYQKLKIIGSYGRTLEGDYFTDPTDLDYVELGYNLRLPSMLAALGLSQLKRVDTLIQKRRKAANYLNKGLKNISDIQVPVYPDNYFAVYQMYTIRVNQSKEVRENLKEYLKSKGIPTKIYFDPVHKYSVFKDMLKDDPNLPNTEQLANQVLSLPIFPDISISELDYILNNIRKFFNK